MFLEVNTKTLSVILILSAMFADIFGFISGAFWKAIIVVFAYVFGMTFPLFVTAYFYDKYKIDQSKNIQGKLLQLKMGAKTLYVHSTNFLSGAMFLIIGATMLMLGVSDNAFWFPHSQAELSRNLNIWTQNIFEVLTIIPEFIWGIIIVGIFSFFVYKVRKNLMHKHEYRKNNKQPNIYCCH